jgi:1-acyl-sn-glycerol-3-phosphate acyltransferase
MMWVVLVLAWGFLCLFSWQVYRNPRGDFETGVIIVVMKLISRFLQRLEVRGGDNIPMGRSPGAFIVIANHTSGVDPIILQAAVDFEIRFMMGADMAIPALGKFWEWTGIIPVDRSRADRTGVRVAIRHLQAGGVLGIFPEGGIERPACRLLPFMSGVGLLVRKTGAPVLPVVISGTPYGDSAFSTILKPGRAVLEFQPMIDYASSELSAEEITEDLLARFQSWTGWPIASPEEAAATAAAAARA